MKRAHEQDKTSDICENHDFMILNIIFSIQLIKRLYHVMVGLRAEKIGYI